MALQNQKAFVAWKGTLAGALLLASTLAQAQGFPSKPIKLVAPFAPGGVLDLVARAVAQKVAEGTGQPVVVDNRAGAAGAIGSDFVAKSPPDGYTLLLGATTTHGINPVTGKVPYDPVKDFAPVSLVATFPHVLVVNATLPVNSLAEFVKYAKSHPGMTYGSAGNGSPHHIAGAMFAKLAGFDAVHVPYKGSGPAMADLIGNQIQFMSVEIGAAEPHIKGGKMKALAIATAKRQPGVNLPTFTEEGYPVEVTAWYAVFAPAGTAPEVIARLNSEIVKGLQSADLRDRFAQLGGTPLGSSPQELANYVRAELDRWGRAVKLANLKLD